MIYLNEKQIKTLKKTIQKAKLGNLSQKDRFELDELEKAIAEQKQEQEEQQMTKRQINNIWDY